FPNEIKAYRPARADRILRDGDKVTLGGTTLTCHLPPGHTRGCTTRTMDVNAHGRPYHVLFVGNTRFQPGVPLVNNSKYPGIAEDFAATYRKLKALPCDVFLAPHASFFGLGDKAERLERGGKPNPFIDPTAFSKFIERAERNFIEQFERERKA